MKLAKVAIYMAAFILTLIFVLFMIYLDDIAKDFVRYSSGRGRWGFGYYQDNLYIDDHGLYYGMHGSSSFFEGNSFILRNGDATVLSRMLTLVSYLAITSILVLIPSHRISSIEKNRTNSRGLLVGFGIFYLLSGLLSIPGILLIIGANTGEKSNAETYSEHGYQEDVYENEYRYDDIPRKGTGSGRKGDTDEYVAERILQVEKDLADLKKRQRKASYDVDDEIDYITKRQNRKFRDLEDDIEDLADSKRKRR